MIVVIYRWRLNTKRVNQFQDAWEKTTLALMEFGAMGSALFSSEDGSYYAIAKWPDASSRQRAFDIWDDGGLIEEMQLAVEEKFPEIVLNEINNLW
ncbi:MAG: hypothetical protein ACRCY3_16830 [Sphingorhabdus sp.]